MRAALLTLSALMLTAALAHAQEPSAADAGAAAPDTTVVASPAEPAADSRAPATVEPTPASDNAAEPKPAELSEAELQQLGFDAAAPAIDYNVHLSGFIDFGMQVPFGPTTTLLAKPAFAIGNLNLYVTKNLTESIRTMAEIRFLYLPNGAAKSLQDRTSISTAAADYSDFNRSLHWGGVEIERVYIEWAMHNLLTIRAGQFLTPYGVWNVDHGSPTIIPTQRPFVIGYDFFPERQTGIELYGRWGVTNNGTLGYHLTLSNGTGPASEYQDLDKNKAVGARAYWEYRKWGELKLGASGYYGRNTDATASAGIVNGKLQTLEKITTQSDSLALAADATFKYQGVLVQAEFITQQLKFTPAGRTLTFSIGSFQSNYPPDAFRYGGYLLLGYRFDWFGLMPYVVMQRVGGVDAVGQAKDRGTPIVVGVNVRPIDSLVVKLEYTQVFFDKGQLFPPDDIQLLNAQLAWAF
jgi:hypothetical protein